MSTRGVDNDYLVVSLSEEVNALLGNLYWVSLVSMTVERALDLGRVHFQLFKSTSSKRISAHQPDTPTALHKLVGKLGARGRLTTALKTDKHDHVRLAPDELIRLVLTSEHLSELVNH